MVLDEDALESMLRRQDGQSDSDERPAAELTDETEEFEVYERPRSEEDDRPEPAPEPASPGPDLVQDDDPFEELPGRNAAEPDAAPENPPAPEPEATRAPTHPPMEEPRQAPAQTEQASRRPRVWPPVGDVERSHKPSQEPAPEAAAEPPAPSPAPTHEAPAPRPEPSPPTTDSGSGCRLAIVQATFNAEITDMMADIARQRADKTGCTVTHTAQVAGVYDLPLTAQALARHDDVDAVVVLGAVVQGETQHDLVITQSTAATLQRVALETGKPIGFGVTGPGMTWGQAEARVVNAKHAVDAAVAQWQALKTA